MDQQNLTILVAFIGLVGAILGAAIATVGHWIISRTERANRLRLAALDKRLEVHQQAYTIWNELLSSIHKENKLSDVARERRGSAQRVKSCFLILISQVGEPTFVRLIWID